MTRFSIYTFYIITIIGVIYSDTKIEDPCGQETECYDLITCGLSEPCSVTCGIDQLYACRETPFRFYSNPITVSCLQKGCFSASFTIYNVSQINLTMWDLSSNYNGLISSEAQRLNMNCLGESSCYNSINIHKRPNAIINHLCGGYGSCKESLFKWYSNTHCNLLCNGEISCEESIFYSYKTNNIHNIYCNGISSCKGVVINAFGAINLHCIGLKSCEHVTINIITDYANTMKTTFYFKSYITDSNSPYPIRIVSPHGVNKTLIICDQCPKDNIWIIYGFKFDKICQLSDINNCVFDDITNDYILMIYDNNTILQTNQLINKHILFVTDPFIIYEDYYPIPQFNFNSTDNKQLYLSILCISGGLTRAVTKQCANDYNLTFFDNVIITKSDRPSIYKIKSTIIGPKYNFIRNNYGSYGRILYYLNNTNKQITLNSVINSKLFIGDNINLKINCIEPYVECTASEIYSTIDITTITNIYECGWNITCDLCQTNTFEFYFPNINNKICTYYDDQSKITDCSEYDAFNTNLQCSTLSPTFSPTISPTDNTFAPTYSPTISPSISPTNIPTKITISPTLSPTISPTITPSNTPTQPPSISPSNSPTQPPSISPTQPPTNIPSWSPVLPPSIAPTFTPSITPTLAPTIPPTLSPSYTPTLAPSITPTFSPTMAPISIKDYNQYFEIIYRIKNLTSDQTLAITFTPNNKENEILREIISIIKYTYIKIAKNFPEFSSLQVSSFQIIKTNLKQKYENTAIELYANIKYINDAIKPFIEFLSTNTDFLNNATYAIREIEAIKNDNTHFEVEIVEAKESTSSFDYVFPALLIMICITTLISFGAAIVNKLKTSKTDNGNWIALIMYGLQIFDFVSDINLSIEILLQFEGKLFNFNKLLLFVSGYGSFIFIIIPYILNIIMCLKIKTFISSNKAAVVYFEQRAAVFAFLVVICGSTYPSLCLLSSRIFGLDQLNSGLTNYELRNLTKLKLWGNVYLENIPQLVCQILYVLYLKDISSNTQLSFFSSLLTIIGSILIYYIEKETNNNHSYVTQYDLEIIKLNKQLINLKQKSLIAKKRERKNELRKLLTSYIKIPQQSIEFGYCTMTGNGCVYHVIHYTLKDTLDQSNSQNNNELENNVNINYQRLANKFVKKLYLHRKNEVNNAFNQHFKFNKDSNFIVKYCDTFGYNRLISNKNIFHNVIYSDDNDNDNNNDNLYEDSLSEKFDFIKEIGAKITNLVKDQKENNNNLQVNEDNIKTNLIQNGYDKNIVNELLLMFRQIDNNNNENNNNNDDDGDDDDMMMITTKSYTSNDNIEIKEQQDDIKIEETEQQQEIEMQEINANNTNDNGESVTL